jgi:ribosome-associated protein
MDISHPTIPESEIVIVYARGSGPGGQKRNKTETKAMLRWDVAASLGFSEAQKERIRSVLGTRITDAGFLALENDETRSREQNRIAVLEEANRLVRMALTPIKKRVATKPTRAARERRLETKKRHGRKKAERRQVE